MSTIHLIFPHQLFEDVSHIHLESPVYLIEEELFFTHYKFHKQKILFHRSSMKQYAAYLESKGFSVQYIEATTHVHSIDNLIKELAKKGVENLRYVDPTDDWLERRILNASKNIRIQKLPNPSFLNTSNQNIQFFINKKRMFQAEFYSYQRKRLGILMDGEHPQEGKWSFDADNRKKYPKTKVSPFVQFPDESDITKEAKQYVESHFSLHLGDLKSPINYPTTHLEARLWLKQFLETRFAEFGEFEDAIVDKELILHHSLLSPLLNVGLLLPEYVISEILDFASKNNIPVNNTEGIIRQIIGWREFIRAVYEQKGRIERTTNFWKFTRKIPPSFYDGTTGILPLDTVIRKVIKTGYCHHIERLMIIGNFMVLCEFDPNDVYQWFMELFIDAYDWVMVPNVYGMSQFADGGLMSTKPYISGSNYILKMSNFKPGDWQNVWDALFWRFMDKNRWFFKKNPRLSMLVGSYDKMPHSKKLELHQTSEKFLKTLDKS
ncbi:MAG: cryptochrome/photolyase family protein [Leadbetterella sp.]